MNENDCRDFFRDLEASDSVCAVTPLDPAVNTIMAILTWPAVVFDAAASASAFFFAVKCIGAKSEMEKVKEPTMSTIAGAPVEGKC